MQAFGGCEFVVVDVNVVEFPGAILEYEYEGVKISNARILIV